MKKGDKVRYIGSSEKEKELMDGRIFEVIRKSGHEILISKPIKYMGGDIHHCTCYMRICDFEKI